MRWIIAVVVGLIVGLIASYLLKGDRRQQTFYSIVLGIIGGLIGVWFFYDLLDLTASTTTANFWLAVLWSFVGSFLFAVIYDLIVSPSSDRDENLARNRYDERSVAHDYDEMIERQRQKDDKNKNK